MKRRVALGLLAVPLVRAAGQSGNPPSEKKPSLPALCVLSKALSGVGYAEIGEIAKQLGFEGIDLTVMPGGMVEPSQAPVDEVRAIESVHGAGLVAPIITTALFTPMEMWCRTVLALAGRTGASLYRTALNPRNAGPQTKRDAFGLAYVGREYKIGMTVPAGAGATEYSPAEALRLIDGFDAQWSGISLSSNCFAANSGVAESEIRDALHRVKAVSIMDLEWREANGVRSAVWRPLGKGTVDFGRLFGMLAKTGFSGPLTVERNYETKDEPGALSRDAEIVRKQIQTAYGALKS